MGEHLSKTHPGPSTIHAYNNMIRSLLISFITDKLSSKHQNQLEEEIEYYAESMMKQNTIANYQAPDASILYALEDYDYQGIIHTEDINLQRIAGEIPQQVNLTTHLTASDQISLGGVISKHE